MSCICNQCENLKIIFEENNLEGEMVESCEFGFPSEDCHDCETHTCTLTCIHYNESISDEVFETTECTSCGKSLKSI